MKKSKLCKAIAMAGALSGLVGGWLYAPAASAVNLSPTGVGDVLIFPYFTARDGWQTTLTFVNTSDTFLAVKFRFMEGYNSRDVLDINVIMSPYDVYTGVLENGGSTGAQFRVPLQETTCSSPSASNQANNAFALNPVAYTGTNADGGPTSNDRLSEGYVVAIVMGHAQKSDLTTIANDTAQATALRNAATALLNAEHPNTAAECTAAANLFLRSNFDYVTPAVPVTSRLFGPPINVLKGNYSFLNVTRGVAAGGNAVTLSNFFNLAANNDAADLGAADPTCTVPYNAQFYYKFYDPAKPEPVAWAPATGAGCPNLLTPQQFPEFLEPSLNDAWPRPAVADAMDNASGLAAPPYTSYTLSGFQAVSEALRATTASNEWSVNPNLGVSTDWVITHPTKSFFTDDPTVRTVSAADLTSVATDVVQAAVNRARFFTALPDPTTAWLPARPLIPLNPFPKAFSGTTATAGQSCAQVGITLRDRDELGVGGGGVIPSPAEPTPARQLCHETNVITFSTNSVFGSTGLLVDLTNDVAALANVATAQGRPVEPFGWLDFNFAYDPAAQGGVTAGVSTSDTGTTLGGPGLPAVGLMMRERVISTTDVSGNYGDASDHSYTRTYPE